MSIGRPQRTLDPPLPLTRECRNARSATALTSRERDAALDGVVLWLQASTDRADEAKMCPDSPTETPSNGPWSIEHFSQGNPAGPGQDDVPSLLRRVADTLEAYGAVRVQDLVLHDRHEITDHGLWPSITVYFRRPPIQLAPPIKIHD